MAEHDERQEKTEEATPRRREEARERGQVALSAELMSAAALVAGFGVVLLGGGYLAQVAGMLVGDTASSLGIDGLADLTPAGAAGIVSRPARLAAGALVLLVAPLALVVLFTGYAQAGVRVTPRVVRWDPSRLNPAKNVARMLSARSLVRTASALLKILLIAATMSAIAWRELPRIAALSGADTGPLLAGMARVGVRCAAGALVAIVFLAVFDYAFQRFQHERDMRMTKKELRDELKNTEGDPQLKARIRQVQRELARSRMMAEVPKATVVVTNPTHYAVALRYDRDADQPGGRAPRVVAKGVERVAARIREVARAAGVPCYEDAPLARALHARVELGDEIPESFYQAVAGVLAYVYRVREDKSAAA